MPYFHKYYQTVTMIYTNGNENELLLQETWPKINQWFCGLQNLHDLFSGVSSHLSLVLNFEFALKYWMKWKLLSNITFSKVRRCLGSTWFIFSHDLQKFSKHPFNSGEMEKTVWAADICTDMQAHPDARTVWIKNINPF